ncbi:MAG: menaquinone biosynthetic enzyme MqnA/MqnD family protein [Acidobacteriota bacterium]
MTARFQIGGLDGLNAAPLLWGLREDQPRAADIQLTLRHPVASARALEHGRANVALIPTISLQMMEGVRVVPGICIAAWRRVRSVLLLSRGKISRIKSIAVDRTSRTSVTLLRILLDRLHGIRPDLVAQEADPEAMLERHDAALLIADAALSADTTGLEVLDLAEQWAEWTGLPFVFAVWGVAPGVWRPDLTDLLAHSRAQGLGHLPRIATSHAGRCHLPGQETLISYLGELLRYTLGPQEETSLNRFYAEAHALDLLPRTRPLRFYDCSTNTSRAAVGERL